MRKYIDAEDITSTIRKVRTKFAIDSVFGENLREDAAAAGALEAVAQVIDILPAADVAEVRHGHWKGINRNKYNDDEATCSVCGVTFSSGYSDPSWWDYCPNCGSRMDLDGDTE